jgi:hypothetical protein
MGMSDKIHAPTSLVPEYEHGTPCTGGWVGLKRGLGGYGEEGLNTKPSSLDEVAELTRPMFPKIFRSRNPFGFRKITTYPYILLRVNIGCPDDRYPKLKIYIPELILDSYEYIPAAYVTMNCMI